LKDRLENRKKAYSYILARISRVSLQRSEKSDLISLDDLIRLKEGLSDPTPELVSALKPFLKTVTSEADIDEHLIKPFHCAAP